MEGSDLVDLDFFSVSDPMCTLRTRESNLKHATWAYNSETEEHSTMPFEGVVLMLPFIVITYGRPYKEIEDE